MIIVVVIMIDASAFGQLSLFNFHSFFFITIGRLRKSFTSDIDSSHALLLPCVVNGDDATSESNSGFALEKSPHAGTVFVLWPAVL